MIRKAVLEGVPEPVEGRGFKPKFLVKAIASMILFPPESIMRLSSSEPK
jgi:hypothetical protein